VTGTEGQTELEFSDSAAAEDRALPERGEIASRYVATFGGSLAPMSRMNHPTAKTPNEPVRLQHGRCPARACERFPACCGADGSRFTN
jgi:hypothetical protein